MTKQEQGMLPGTAPLTPAQLAQRKINQPLIAKVAQKPMDIGLFGDEREQLDLITLAKEAE